MAYEESRACGQYLKRYFSVLAGLALLTCLLVAPYTLWWLYSSGDVAVERAVAAQRQGGFVVFGSGVSQDFVDYKLQLYAAIKPTVAVVGSSRVMQFRSRYFRVPFCNVGGTAGNLPVLRSTIDAMLRIHRPQAVIIGLDFWWFMPTWNADPFAEEPPTSGSYVYGLETLKKPWIWLLEGKISPKELLAPILPESLGGFRTDRYGIMAQQTNDGFGPDGSWYYTAESTGQKRPFDYQFADTLKQVAYGIKAFYRVPQRDDDSNGDGISQAHLDAFAEIYCRLKARNIPVFVFIAPLSSRVLEAMRAQGQGYPHLFRLREALQSRGIDVVDFTDPRTLASNDCEFFDGFHGGEVTYARLLRRMADRWPGLKTYVAMEALNEVIHTWKGYALVFDERLSTRSEIDFMHFGCPKRKP
ncbi:MAG: hypothetical protein IJU37_03415 [Desulfovibrio sp.]|nr:hypothetical protein [Desulfovibrio sp.]